MVRRGISLEFARLMTYAQHCVWESWLFESMHREPPPGYQRPSLQQVIQCDKAAWSRLGSTLTDVRQTAAGVYQLGEALLNLRHDPSIALYLAPIQKSSQSSGHASSSTSTWRPGPFQQNAPKGRSKSKGGKKGGKGGPPTPSELRGKWHKLANGEPICFGYNCASGCAESSKVKPGERCSKGWHVCAEPRCQKAHSMQQDSTSV